MLNKLIKHKGVDGTITFLTILNKWGVTSLLLKEVELNLADVSKKLESKGKDMRIQLLKFWRDRLRSTRQEPNLVLDYVIGTYDM